MWCVIWISHVRIRADLQLTLRLSIDFRGLGLERRALRRVCKICATIPYLYLDYRRSLYPSAYTHQLSKISGPRIHIAIRDGEACTPPTKTQSIHASVQHRHRTPHAAKSQPQVKAHMQCKTNIECAHDRRTSCHGIHTTM
jgi:hypothetical protein